MDFSSFMGLQSLNKLENSLLWKLVNHKSKGDIAYHRDLWMDQIMPNLGNSAIIKKCLITQTTY